MRSATVMPAAFVGKTKEFGRIVVGQRADLLLVANNPLENLAAETANRRDGSGQMAPTPKT
jgi:imidazolonepropionase-like amidohydrolase